MVVMRTTFRPSVHLSSHTIIQASIQLNRKYECWPDCSMELRLSICGCCDGSSWWEGRYRWLLLCTIIWFACGQGHGKEWVPYHIRVRSFFERWPGAMKAWKLGVISLAWMLLYSWEALPESPQDAAAEIEAEASEVPGFGVLAPDWGLLSFVAWQLSYASPLKPFFRRTKRMWLKFMILQPNKLCFVNSTGRCVVCLQAIWIHFLWVRFISISSS